MRSVKQVSSLRTLTLASQNERDRARAALAHAEKQALEVIAQAEARAEELAAAARAQGYAQGLRDAHRSLLKALEASQQRMDQLETESAEVALEIARSILSYESRIDGQLVRTIASKALSRLRRAQRIVVYIRPDDRAVVEREIRGWIQGICEPRTLDIVDDPALDGGVRIESDLGVVDGTLSAQLDVLRRALKSP
ncbi:MAG: FliH/SctL family protein [Deltaproteobacteria bacterium]|nr:FliH/SctL family protein [Deltaproteobacteria bacterium]